MQGEPGQGGWYGPRGPQGPKGEMGDDAYGPKGGKVTGTERRI